MAFELMNNGKAAKKLADYVKVSNRTWIYLMK
jgi:orotate phosphoribosyltransferase-like protein